MAGDYNAALESLRLFLATAPEGENSQQARPIAIFCAVKKKFIGYVDSAGEYGVFSELETVSISG